MGPQNRGGQSIRRVPELKDVEQPVEALTPEQAEQAEGALGDASGTGVVDAADYVVWRKNPGPRP